MGNSKISRFFRVPPTCVCVGWLGAVAFIAATWSLHPAYGSENAATAPAQASGCEWLQKQLDASKKARDERSPGLQARLGEIEALLQGLDDTGESIQKDTLAEEQKALQNESKFLDSAHTAWQAAVDACKHTARLKQEKEIFQASGPPDKDDCTRSTRAVLRTQLDAIQDAPDIEAENERAKRRADLQEMIKTADEQTRHVYKLEQQAGTAEAEFARAKGAKQAAERDLFQAKLAACDEAFGPAPDVPDAPGTEAPGAEKHAAEIKKELAEQIRAEAKKQLADVQAKIDKLEEQITAAQAKGNDTTDIDNDLEYRRRVETYEQGRMEQAELQTRLALKKEEMGQLDQPIEDARNKLEELMKTRLQMTPQQREEQAARYQEKAKQRSKEEKTLLEKAGTEAKAEEKHIKLLQKRLVGIDASQSALRERLNQAGNLDSNHFRLMEGQYNSERQLIDWMVATHENIAYANWRQARSTRELADLHEQCANELVPPVPPIWENAIIRSICWGLGILSLLWAVRPLKWLIRGAVSGFNALFNRRRSAMRIVTWVSFGGSILKLGIVVYALIKVLSELGIEPSKSSGPIALFGLILAGMFQQIVIDIVKGFDILVGRHYNVGDFVEVDGKHGHVVDFNIKYTRIRSFAGQEFNIPNSRCVPSRRFPDGFVSNYVDITLKSPADEDRAKIVVGAVCAEINQRIEPVRDLPTLSECFHGRHDGVTLRYRVRVLPDCDWVVKDHFIPAVKEAMAKEDVELAGEPTVSTINRIETFRKLFSRRLSEEEIVRKVGHTESDPDADEEGEPQPTSSPQHPPGTDRDVAI